MTPLESKIAALLVDIGQSLPEVTIYGQKWVPLSESQAQLRTIEDQSQSIVMAWARNMAKVKALPAFTAAKDAFDRDSVFAHATKGAGYWATFDAVIQKMLLSAARKRRSRLEVDVARGLDAFRAIRGTYSKGHLGLQASARLIGVTLKNRVLQLPDQISLHRLTLKERTQRQPFVHIGFGPAEGNDGALLQHSTELRVGITVPVKLDAESGFFRAMNGANLVANETFGRVLHAILLAMPGSAAIGRIKLDAEGLMLPVAQQVTRGDIWMFSGVTLNKRDLRRLSIAYDLVVGGPKSDKTLARALHRFLLGRQRTDFVDKLVDYVISWEALLLTQEGNPISQELSYRFSLNGASLISRATKAKDRSDLYKKMHSAYRTRSSVVHGGTDSERDKALAAGAFPTINNLCEFLEQNFRAVVLWLSNIPSSERPYRAPSGWEKLLWD
jgi:hypothetical protein